ncbi:hypothetical protein D3C72_127750 [compost metagenome]
MQWGDFVAELWLYVPLVGFWLVAITLGIVAIVSSIRDRNRPGGIDYEFTASEPEPGRRLPQGKGAPERPKQSVRIPRTPDVNRPES